MSTQIKSRKRVADFGEVYTAQKQMNDMLALLSDDMPLEATYLEPACGATMIGTGKGIGM